MDLRTSILGKLWLWYHRLRTLGSQTGSRKSSIPPGSLVALSTPHIVLCKAWSLPELGGTGSWTIQILWGESSDREHTCLPRSHDGPSYSSAWRLVPRSSHCVVDQVTLKKKQTQGGVMAIENSWENNHDLQVFHRKRRTAFHMTPSRWNWWWDFLVKMSWSRVAPAQVLDEYMSVVLSSILSLLTQSAKTVGVLAIQRILHTPVPVAGAWL